MKKILISLIFILAVSISANAQSVQILEQTDAPLTINEFTAQYQEGGRYSSEGIRYDVSFTNNTDQEIVAYAIGFYAFDVFNRSLGRPLSGFSVTKISPGDSDDGAWVQRVSSPSLFKDYGTGIAYIAKARLADGTVWSYDEGNILSQLQEFEESLTLDDLSSQ